MSSRVTGAGLALIAVALLAVSIATPVVLPARLSLFAGHPTVAHHVRETQDVYVGFYSARLCNVGGDGTCKSGEATGGFRVLGFAELALTGLLVVITVALAALTLRRSERRKTTAVLVWIVSGLALAAGGGLIWQGPFHGASVPLGIGMVLHGAGIASAMLAGVLAMRRPPPIRLRVADRGPRPVAARPEGFSLRPSSPAASPASRPLSTPRGGGDPPRAGELGSSASAALSPGDADQGSNPFAPPLPTQPPLFSSAPQLRPLYEAAPVQGGTGGLLPIERPAMPIHPPAPLSRAEISAATGNPVPGPVTTGEPWPMPRPLTADEPVAMGPPFSAGEPWPMPRPPAGEELRAMGPNPAARIKPPSLPPPLPPAVAAASLAPSLAPSGQTAAKPHTQISLVPPMPDHDPPIAPPTAQVVAGGGSEAAQAPGIEPTLFPRAETPLAPPPAPVAPPLPPRTRRESQLPPPLRGHPPTRPPLRPPVPMPERPARPAPSPTRPPAPAPLPAAPPRPPIAAVVPRIPAIPAIPPGRADTDVTDPEGRAATAGGTDPVTASRIPIEIADNASQTNVSVGVPSPEEIDAAVEGAGAFAAVAAGAEAGGGHALDTSPSGEPVVIEPAGDAAIRAGEPGAMSVAATPAASRPAPSPGPRPAPILPGVVAPPSSPPSPSSTSPRTSPRTSPGASPRTSPGVRDRPPPKLPLSTAPDSLPPPKDNKQAIGPSPACPQCEAPMAWVEEHLRFYCRSCRMYF